MWSNSIVLVFCLIIVTAKRTDFIRDRPSEDQEEDGFHMKKRVDIKQTTTGRSAVGDAVVEKFVETLMSSERYLKMIESVERKMNHLDTTFHERTNSILKYLSEMLRMIKTSSSEMLEKALRNVKLDLDKLKQSMSERLDEHPNMRDSIVVQTSRLVFDKCRGIPSPHLPQILSRHDSFQMLRMCVLSEGHGGGLLRLGTLTLATSHTLPWSKLDFFGTEPCPETA
uniref:Uncharacterized protein n=1 Tax=Heliothis virescens TaxID=7102 RepID=A0A2A4J0G4_HELVI